MSLQDTADTIARVVERVGPAVAGLGRGWGVGSGVVVEGGRVVTNAHNLRGEETVVTFADGRRAPGRATGVDIDGDLAVLAVDTGDAPALAWSTGEAGVGTAVLGFANPGGRGLRASVGFVSATDVAFRGPGGRKVGGALEHTAPLARGSSGGPLVDSDGKLVGIDTHRVGDGFYLAVPANADLERRVDALGRGEEPDAPASGSPWHPRRWPSACAVPWACPSATGSSCAPSRRVVPPTPPVSRATSSRLLGDAEALGGSACGRHRTERLRCRYGGVAASPCCRCRPRRAHHRRDRDRRRRQPGNRRAVAATT